MRRFFSLFLVLLLVIAACTPITPRPDELTFPPLAFSLPTVEKTSLVNGTKLYLRQDHELPLIDVTAMVGVGRMHDPAAKAGLCALYAATLRNGGAGSRDGAAVDDLLAQMAGELGVSCDNDALTLHLSIPAEEIDHGLSLLTDLLRHPRFENGRFELARRQKLEAIRRQNDRPTSIAHRLLAEAIYGDHPLGRMASEASLQRIDREDLLVQHDLLMNPENLWLAISGDFDANLLKKKLTTLFDGWNSGGGGLPPLPARSAISSPRLLLVDKPLPQSTILFGELGVDKSSPDLAAIRVMNYILGGGGFNSRLMREVRSNRGLAYSVYSYFRVGRRLPGTFLAGCETRSDATATVIELIRQEMERLRREPVSVEELHLAKESLINSFVFAFTGTHAILTQAMRIDLFGYPSDYLERFREQVAAVTVDDVLSVAQKYLHPERQVLVVVGDTSVFVDALGAEEEVEWVDPQRSLLLP